MFKEMLNMMVYTIKIKKFIGKKNFKHLKHQYESFVERTSKTSKVIFYSYL